jgi:phytoene synthase
MANRSAVSAPALDVAPADQQPVSAARRASGSSFYLAMRILPAPQRAGMYQVYSFCRLVDDIADSDGPRLERLAQLAAWRADIEAVYAGGPPEHLRDLAQTVHDFSLRQEDFLAVITGMEMDAAQDIRAPDDQTLDFYCDCVASAVGRLSTCIFGMNRVDGELLSHHLGRALQLTNILRDLDEDAEIGRLYLPRQALIAAGIEGTDPATVLASPALATACQPLIDRARVHYQKANEVMDRTPRKCVRAPRIMAGAYDLILNGMVARGWAPPRTRVRLDRLRSLWIVARYALF